MNDKSRFDELLIKAVAPQGGTPGSSQSEVREDKPQEEVSVEQCRATNCRTPEHYPQPQATQEKCEPCQIEGNNGTCDRKDCSNSPTQEKHSEDCCNRYDGRGKEITPKNGGNGHAPIGFCCSCQCSPDTASLPSPTQESQTWEEDAIEPLLIRTWGNQAGYYDWKSFIRTAIETAIKNREREIWEEAKEHEFADENHLYHIRLTALKQILHI